MHTLKYFIKVVIKIKPALSILYNKISKKRIWWPLEEKKLLYLFWHKLAFHFYCLLLFLIDFICKKNTAQLLKPCVQFVSYHLCIYSHEIQVDE